MTASCRLVAASSCSSGPLVPPLSHVGELHPPPARRREPLPCALEVARTSALDSFKSSMTDPKNRTWFGVRISNNARNLLDPSHGRGSARLRHHAYVQHGPQAIQQRPDDGKVFLGLCLGFVTDLIVSFGGA